MPLLICAIGPLKGLQGESIIFLVNPADCRLPRIYLITVILVIAKAALSHPSLAKFSLTVLDWVYNDYTTYNLGLGALGRFG